MYHDRRKWFDLTQQKFIFYINFFECDKLFDVNSHKLQGFVNSYAIKKALNKICNSLFFWIIIISYFGQRSWRQIYYIFKLLIQSYWIYLLIDIHWQLVECMILQDVINYECAIFFFIITWLLVNCDVPSLNLCERFSANNWCMT